MRLSVLFGLWTAIVAAGLDALPTYAQAPPRPSRYTINDAERADLKQRAEHLAESLARLKEKADPALLSSTNELADVLVFHKAARWILQENEFFNKNYVAMTIKALDTGEARVRALLEGKSPANPSRGGTIRGYVSEVDGSIQPYAIYVPDDYDGQTPTRLDIVLHGRGATLNEVSFINAHDGKPMPEGETGLILHVFGRGNNAYRWAGEADVFEALRSVERNYRVDDRRIVLRGFSMGGAGAWHLGLHHPRVWCSVEAGAGFTDTKNYIGRREYSDVEEKALHIYDAVDYALNAFNVPMAGYGGEEDKQLQASLNIKKALEDLGFKMVQDGLVTRGDGIDFLHVIGAKTGHKVDPVSAKILKEYRDEHATRGQDLRPSKVRFVTYTLAYNRAHWLAVEALKEQYQRTEVEAEARDDTVFIHKAENVAVLSVNRDLGQSIRFGEQEFPLRSAVEGLLPDVYFRKVEDGWIMLDHDQSRALQLNLRREKRPGVQGPIDHAFAGPFLCVRGTGRPWNPNIQAWADARLERFAREWRTYLRGDIRIKNDVDVTPDDVQDHHLILFGDPGSNTLIAQLLGDLPLSWTKSEVSVAGGSRYASADHVPALIVPNPVNPLRYVVLNSGHTFGARDFEGTNALLYPRLGDYAVLRVRNQSEEILNTGFFDESWKGR